MAARTSGTLGLTLRGEGGASVTCFIATAMGPSASNGGLPVSISKRTIPKEYRSLAGPTSPPLACSGER
jgi:hypothetical protein